MITRPQPSRRLARPLTLVSPLLLIGLAASPTLAAPRHARMMAALVALAEPAAVPAAQTPSSAPASNGGQAQPAQPQTPPTPDPSQPPISPGELTRLFDAYAVLQAQNFLKLTDEQYGEFVVRLKALQDVRRQHQVERQRLLAELRKLTAPDATATDAAIHTAFDALTKNDVAAQADIAKAYENIDSVLDLRQRGRFRVFEDQLEKQKLNLLSRVRRRPVVPGESRNQK